MPSLREREREMPKCVCVCERERERGTTSESERTSVREEVSERDHQRARETDSE